ncbi:unnamed protein product, partial [Polarella glacialis]
MQALLAKVEEAAQQFLYLHRTTKILKKPGQYQDLMVLGTTGTVYSGADCPLANCCLLLAGGAFCRYRTRGVAQMCSAVEYHNVAGSTSLGAAASTMLCVPCMMLL